MITTPFSTIYDYFYSNLNDDDLLTITPVKAKGFLKAGFADYIQYVDSNASIDYTAEILTTSDTTLSEFKKTLLGLLMYKQFLKQKKQMWAGITAIVADSHRIQDVASTKRSYEELYDECENDINNLLATLL